jgi:hypothetical protein
MNKLNRKIVASVTAAACVCAAPSTMAIGFGRVAPVAVLGQMLDVSIPVRVEASEQFDADCAHVDVRFGESRLLPNQVRMEVLRVSDDTWRVHVITLVPVTEPVVEIGVTAGCDRGFTRRYTAFADPPMRVARGGEAAPAAGPTVATSGGASPGAAGPATELSAAADGSLRGPSAAGSRGARGAQASRAGKGPTRAAAAALDRGARGSRAAAAARGGSAVATAGHAPRGADAGARLVLDSGFAHLKLDMEDPVMPAAGAASGAAIALAELEQDPDVRRLQSLEQNLQALRKETQASRDQTLALQARLAQAESRADWLPLILGALGLSLVAVGALGWRVRRQARPRAAKPWFQESMVPTPSSPGIAAAAASVRTVSSDTAAEAAADAGAAHDKEPPALDQVVPPDATPAAGYVEDLSATQPLSRAALAAAMHQAEHAPAPRELSVEELLDLEQQADFFIALGQEDAAIDLLMSHLRSAGGQSPLPYTKLLEIYRRQGDRAAYERMRARFNRRFNAYAPDWDVGPGAGRTLEDYPDTIAQIQAVWHSPIDAMAILEALLFKRDDTSELFDLPAYRDVLVLYSLARDLWHLSDDSNGTLVDVLLPLDDYDPDAPTLPPEPEPAVTVEPEPPTMDVGGLVPSRAPSSEPSAYELTGFDLLADRPDGGVQATLDAAHLPAPRPGASNDESLPPAAPGATRGPSSHR